MSDPTAAPSLDVSGAAVGEALASFTPPPTAEGSVLLDVSTERDGVLLRLQGERGTIELSVHGGALLARLQGSGPERTLDAEDCLGLDDGARHTVILTVDESGTHLLVDGYEGFSSTSDLWLADLGPTVVEADPDSVMSVSRVAWWTTPLDARQGLTQTPRAEPFLSFAAPSLDARDTDRCSALAEGSIRARFRTRGRGQQGVVVAARGHRGTLRLAVRDGDLVVTAEVGARTLVLPARGRWDDGTWHDVVLTAARGALTVHVDGWQVARTASTIFLAALAPLDTFLVGSDLDGTRLFGDVEWAHVHDRPLSDHQIRRLSDVAPLPTRALFDTGLASVSSYRIPAVVTLASGVVLAACDARVSSPNDAPNDIALAVRRSEDGGLTWGDLRIVASYPGQGLTGACITDPVLVEDRHRGRVLVLADHLGGGVGQPTCRPGTGRDAEGRPVLVDREGNLHTVDEDGRVHDAQGQPTGHTVAPDGELTREGAPCGNIHLPAPWHGETELFRPPTGYVVMLSSDDDGLTWQGPVDVTAQLKEDWMGFLGTSPGTGIQLEHGSWAGRILVPIYHDHPDHLTPDGGGDDSGPSAMTFVSSVAISDDGGQTWRRGGIPDAGGGSLYESTLVEDEDATVHVWIRNQDPSARVGHAVSRDGGLTWSRVEFDPQLPEIFSQPHAVRVHDEDGRPGVVFANASRLLPFRGCGVLRLSWDDGETWTHHRTLNPRHHVYQCLTQLPDGDLGVLWEREWQGLFWTRVPLGWLTGSLAEDS